MKYYSEELHRCFDTKEECIKAEKDLMLKKREEAEAKALEEKKNKELVEKRKARAEEVTKAYKDVREARERADAKLAEYLKDYGVFYNTEYIKDPKDFNLDFFPKDIFKNLFNWFK